MTKNKIFRALLLSCFVFLMGNVRAQDADLGEVATSIASTGPLPCTNNALLLLSQQIARMTYSDAVIGTGKGLHMSDGDWRPGAAIYDAVVPLIQKAVEDDVRRNGPLVSLTFESWLEQVIQRSSSEDLRYLAAFLTRPAGRLYWKTVMDGSNCQAWLDNLEDATYPALAGNDKVLRDKLRDQAKEAQSLLSARLHSLPRAEQDAYYQGYNRLATLFFVKPATALVRAGSDQAVRRIKQAMDPIWPEIRTVIRTQHAASSPNSYEYKVSYILVATRADADRILQALSDGGSFADLAKRYSIDTATGTKGGDLGWIRLKDYPAPFAEAVRNTVPGSYSPALAHTAFGWHVTKVDAIRGAAPGQDSITVHDVETIANNAEQSCLRFAPAVMSGNNKITAMMGKWLTDPAICSCEKNLVRAQLTGAMLELPSDQLTAYINNLFRTKGAECIVPVLKEKYANSCEQMIAAAFSEKSSEDTGRKLAERGYSSLAEFSAHFCGCVRPGLQEISTKAWMDSSTVAYNAYLKRRQSGTKPDESMAPDNPFGKLIDSCMGPGIYTSNADQQPR